MNSLKNIFNYILNAFYKIPVYLRGIILFVIFVLISIMLNKFNSPNSVFNKNRYIIMEESKELNNQNTNNLVRGEVIEYKKSMSPSTTRKKNKKTPKNLTDFSGDYFFGNEDSPVVIIEFSNYECPFCLKFHENVMSDLKKNYIDTGKVKYVKRMIIQTNTLLGVILPYCAPENNRYSLVEELYSNVSLWTNTTKQKKELKKIALRNGFTEDSYDECIKNSVLAKKLLERQKEDLGELRIYSTPTVFVNGSMQRGKLSYQELKEVVDYELQKMKNK